MAQPTVDPKLKYETIGYLTEGAFGVSTLVHVRSNNAHTFVMKKVNLINDGTSIEQQMQQQTVMVNGQPKVMNKRPSLNSLINVEKDRITKLIKSLMKISFHDSIVYIIDGFLSKDLSSIYIITEYCKEDSLKAKLHRLKLIKSYLSDETIFKWFNQTISAIKYLHTNGILHGNVKPQNFLLTCNGERIKLTDFGYLSLFVTKQQRNTYIHNLITTNYDFLPKETVESNDYTHLSDIYSIGCIFFEIIFFERYHWSHEYLLFDLKTRCSDEHFAYLLTSMLSQSAVSRPNISNIYKFCELKNNFYLYDNNKLALQQQQQQQQQQQPPVAPAPSLQSTVTESSVEIFSLTAPAPSFQTSQSSLPPPPPAPPASLALSSKQQTIDGVINQEGMFIQPTNRIQLIKRNLFIITFLTTQKQNTDQPEAQPQSQQLKEQQQQQQQQQAKKFILKQIHLNDRNLKLVQSQIYKVNLVAHNNLMQLYQNVFINKRLYLLIEYQYNGSLAKIIFEQKLKEQKFPENLILQWLLQILNGLQYLHSNSIIHTNLKCENILFTKNNLLKLSDFGYNHLLQKFDANFVISNFPVEYSAPEIIYSNGDNYSIKSDVWSFGAVLCKCLTFKNYQQLLELQDQDEQAQVTPKPINRKNKPAKHKQLEKIGETSFVDYNEKTVKFADDNENNTRSDKRDRKTNEQPKIDYKSLIFDLTNPDTNFYKNKEYEYKLKMLGSDYTYSLKETIIDMLNEKPSERPNLSDVLSNLRNLVSVNYSKLTTTKALTKNFNGNIETFLCRNYLHSSNLNDFLIVAKLNEKVYSSYKLKFIDNQNSLIDPKTLNNLNEMIDDTAGGNILANQKVSNENKLIKTEIPNKLPKLLCTIENNYLLGCDSDFFYLIDENFYEVKHIDLIDRLQKHSGDNYSYIEINNEKLSTNSMSDRVNLKLDPKAICYDHHKNKVFLLITIQERCSLLIMFDIEVSVYPMFTHENNSNNKQQRRRSEFIRHVHFDLVPRNTHQIALNSQGSKAMYASNSYLFICERERLIRAYNKSTGRYVFCIKSQTNKANVSLDSFRKESFKERTIENITKFLTLNNSSNNPVDICGDINGNLYLACPSAIEVYNDKGEFIWKHDIPKEMGLITRISINKYGSLAFIAYDQNDTYKNKLYIYP